MMLMPGARLSAGPSRAGGEYWELWHGDGFSNETSAAVAKIWQEARRLGYDDYRKKLISEGKYRQR